MRRHLKLSKLELQLQSMQNDDMKVHVSVDALRNCLWSWTYATKGEMIRHRWSDQPAERCRCVVVNVKMKQPRTKRRESEGEGGEGRSRADLMLPEQDGCRHMRGQRKRWMCLCLCLSLSYLLLLE